MTVREIITDYLKVNGFDGLCRPGCGCGLDDLAPCGCNTDQCMPAFKRIRNDNCPDDCEGDVEIGEQCYCLVKGK
jgi:hypothetical protein